VAAWHLLKDCAASLHQESLLGFHQGILGSTDDHQRPRAWRVDARGRELPGV
jgi:hypothetical protein